MPYEHGQPPKRKKNHPVVQQIRDAGAAADKNSGWCGLLLLIMLAIPVGTAVGVAYVMIRALS